MSNIDNTYGKFAEKTKEEVLELVKKYGNPENMQDSQNDAPTMQEFLAMADKLPEIRYHGYIIHKPREDFRVSIEGFEVSGLNADTTLDLMEEFGYADEVTHSKQADGTYSLRTWWD